MSPKLTNRILRAEVTIVIVVRRVIASIEVKGLIEISSLVIVYVIVNYIEMANEWLGRFGKIVALNVLAPSTMYDVCSPDESERSIFLTPKYNTHGLAE